MSSPRLSAGERREAVLEAATHVFAQEGFHGASTDDIARAAGISQPYLFRLFGSKKKLFLETTRRCSDELYEVFAGAAQGKSGSEALRAMGEAYSEIMRDRDRLLLMLKSWTESDDPDIRAANRRAWRNLVDLAEQVSGEPAIVIQRFFASGMLITILMAMDLLAEPEPWAQRLLAACEEAMQA